MTKLIMTKGLPGSGKSTWAKFHVSSNIVNSWKRVNKDDLRAMLDIGRYSKGAEKLVLDIRDNIINFSLDRGMNVIVDDTNLDPKHEARLRDLANLHGAIFEIQDFTDVTIEECIRRDLQRPNSIGKDVILKLYHRYFKNVDRQEPVYREQIKSNPPVIICDLDGTLALLGNRNPYEDTKCEQDRINYPVLDLLHDLSNVGHTLIFVSGRQDRAREQTKKWLTDVCFFSDFCLFMRETGDTRRDSVVKKEIYDKYIRDNFYVQFVLDDRNQVVDMWRNELHLPCFQVFYGDF